MYVKLTLAEGGKVNSSDGMMSITLSFIQLISLLTTFPIAWPNIFVALFAVGGAITVLGQHLVNLKCLLPDLTEAQVFYTILLVWACLPFILVLLCQLFWRCSTRIASNIANKIGLSTFRVINVEQKLHTSTVCVLYLIWPSLCSQTFSAFACRKVCGGDMFLRADIDEPCWQDRHLMYVLLVGTPMMLVHVLGLPVAAFIAIRKLQNRALKRETSTIFLKGHQTWGIFYSAFRSEVWW